MDDIRIESSGYRMEAMDMDAVAVRAEEPLAPLTAGPDYVSSFLADLDVAPVTRAAYTRNLSRFTTWAEEEGITHPTRETIVTYKRGLEERGVSPYTVNAYLVPVRLYFKWLQTQRIYPDVTAGIKGAHRPRGFNKDNLTAHQVKDLLAGIDQGTLAGKRDHAVITLMIHTGVRTIEVARANIEDMRTQGGKAVLFVHGKGRDSKDEFVKLTPPVLAAINSYLQARGKVEETAPLFAALSNRDQGGRLTTRSISRIVKGHLQGVGLDNGRLTAHSLRHTAVTLSIIAGATIEQARGMARHSSISTTMIYSHAIDRLADGAEEKIAELLAATV